MTTKRVIVDRRFEQHLDEVDRSWFIVDTLEEVVGILRTWVCERVVLHHRFSPDLAVIPPTTPLVLVFDREAHPPTLDRIIPLLNHVDMVIPRKLLTCEFASILTGPPYLSRWSEDWIRYYPENARGFLGVYQNLLQARVQVDRRHWRVFQEWAEGPHNIEEVARLIKRHPKTVRHSLGVVSDSLGLDRIDQISRESLREFLRLVDPPKPWQEEQ